MTKRQSSGIERTINPNRADDRPESTGESYGIEQTIGRNRPENLPVSSRQFYRIVLVELLFSPGGTFIFCW